MKVLSLFDGMSCGKVALQRANRLPALYFASEIDKYAIKVSNKNYPKIIQLGCVKNVRKLAEAGFFGWVDLLIAGSPCQGFSYAGEGLAFNDPRSALFFEFLWTLWALRRVNPNIKFMLENVKMKKEHLDVITNFLGVQPICINSSLVSAQNRVRYYWCNWKIEQPQDRGIYLKDIIESGEVDRDKSRCIIASIGRTTEREYFKMRQGQMVKDTMLSERELAYMNRPTRDGRTHWDFKHHSDTANQKSAPVVANFAKGVPYNVLVDREDVRCAAIRGRNIVDGKRKDYLGAPTEQRIEIRADEKTNCLTTVQKDNVLVYSDLKKYHKKNFKELDEKAFCLTSTMNKGAQANGQTILSEDGVIYRKLTPVEYERLQTLDDNYTAGVSNSQRYKMLGNGWNVETIAHIFRSMPQ